MNLGIMQEKGSEDLASGANMHISDSSGSNQAVDRHTRKYFSTKMVSRFALGGAAGCGVLLKGSLMGGCQDKVSRTTAAAPGRQII